MKEVPLHDDLSSTKDSNKGVCHVKLQYVVFSLVGIGKWLWEGGELHAEVMLAARSAGVCYKFR
jgi:hypothetical protein